MALTVNTNSYVTRDEANAYFADRLNSDTWDDASDTDKDKALIQATQLLESKDYLGTITSSTQILKFPRYGLYYEGYPVPSDTVPQRVKDAQCEMALWCLSEDYTEPNDLADYSRIKIAVLEVETRSSGAKPLPPMVTKLLSPFMMSGTRLVRG